MPGSATSAQVALRQLLESEAQARRRLSDAESAAAAHVEAVRCRVGDELQAAHDEADAEAARLAHEAAIVVDAELAAEEDRLTREIAERATAAAAQHEAAVARVVCWVLEPAS